MIPQKQLEKVVDLAAESLNVAEKVLSGGGILAAFALSDELAALKGLDGKQVVEQLKNLLKDKHNALQLSERFRGKLDLKNDALEAKIESGFEVLIVDAVGLAFVLSAAVSQVKEVVEKVKSILA